MASYLTVEMIKTYGNNTTGDICAFSESTARELEKKGACTVLGPIDVVNETWDVVAKKAVPKRKPDAPKAA